MKPKVPLLVFTLVFTTLSYSQKMGVDGKEKSVFTYYTFPSDRLSINAEGSVNYTFVFGLKDEVWVRTRTRDVTVVKKTGWTIDLGLTTDETFLSSENLSKLRPGLDLKFGKQKSIDTFNSIDIRLPNRKKSVKTYGFNIIFKIDNIRLFDSTLKQNSKKYPLTYGGEVYYNFIFRNLDTLNKHRIVLAFTGSATRTWNDDDLLSYQDIGDAIVTSEVVALEEFEGRFGILKPNVNSLRFSISLPMYFGNFNPIPFLVFNAKSFSMPSYRFGGFLNVLSKKLDQRKFSIPSSLGVGIDWKVQERKIAKGTLFVKGTIDF